MRKRRLSSDPQQRAVAAIAPVNPSRWNRLKP